MPRHDPVGEDAVLAEIRRRQRGRAVVMAALLFAFVILVFFISIAKMVK
ncbi:MAG: hypothetical protein JOY99_15260 [Sphingomonadaceae bacterium]|nr:hypothetical protein [Sphingomonadaceae bacterium]